MRTDSASWVMEAPARVIYAAPLDPDAVARWRPLAGIRHENHGRGLRSTLANLADSTKAGAQR